MQIQRLQMHRVNKDPHQYFWPFWLKSIKVGALIEIGILLHWFKVISHTSDIAIDFFFKSELFNSFIWLFLVLTNIATERTVFFSIVMFFAPVTKMINGYSVYHDSSNENYLSNFYFFSERKRRWWIVLSPKLHQTLFIEPLGLLNQRKTLLWTFASFIFRILLK